MKRVISGLTATGKLTLGNYIGAINNLKKAQNDKDKEIFMFVADLHALTLPIDPEILKSNVYENIALYLAAGIDITKVNLFIQSHITGHTELFYLLSVNSYQGELNRMTQFKDKVEKLTKKQKMLGVPVGLYVYPLLMAADIILYNADEVIVGEDQKQHLELTRTLIERINNKYGVSFNVPTPNILEVGNKIMALKTPEYKMSKSDSDLNNTIFLLDKPEIIKKKIGSSLTDSEDKVYFDKEKKPGVSNLITIYSVMTGKNIEDSVKELENLDYKEFKEKVSEAIILVLEPLQEKFKMISKDEMDVILNANYEKIQSIAKENLDKIYKGVGLNE